MAMNKQTKYTHEDIVSYNMTKHKDIIPYNHISKIRGIIGTLALTTGLITLPLPSGSIFLVCGGCYLLGYDSKVIIKNSIFHLKELKNWVYRQKKAIKKLLVKSWRSYL